MDVRLRFVLLTLAALVGLSVLGVWSFSNSLSRHNRSQVQRLTQKQVLGIRQATEFQVQYYASELTRLLSEMAGQSTPRATSNFRQSPFFAVSLLELDAQNRWTPSWTVRNNSKTSHWPGNFLSRQVRDTPLAMVQKDQVVWHRVQDPKGRPLFLMMIQVRKSGSAGRSSHIGVSVLGEQAFANVTASAKGDGEAIVFDQRGYAYGFSEPQYIGAKFDNHSFVKEAIKQRQPKLSQVSFDLDGRPVFAAAERLSDTNLYVAVSHPIPPAAVFYGEQFWTMMIWVIAMGLLVLGIGYLLLEPFRESYFYLRNAVILAAQKQPFPLPAEVPIWLAPAIEPLKKLAISHAGLSGDTPINQVEKDRLRVTSSDSDKTESYKKLGAGLSEALQGPIAAILGHAQMARSKAGENESKDHYITIEREARRVREIIENLMRISKAQDQGDEKSVRTDVQDVVMAALSSVRDMAQDKGVHISKKLQVGQMVKVHPGKLQTVLEEILRNSIESMNATTKKDLSVTGREKKGRIQIIVEDTGSGISGGDLPKIFDPFFTTHDNEDNTGMGLTVAKGIVKSMQGEISIDSKEGEGTRVIIELPSASRSAVRMSPAQADPEKEEITQLSPPDAETQPDINLEEEDENKLAGLNPITGSQADELPTAPESDEITFIGADPIDEKTPYPELTEEQLTDVPEKPINRPPQVKSTSTEPPGEEEGSSEDDGEDEESVSIRRPKLRLKN